MAHVAFATWQDNTTPENSSGFNGFPFPTPTYEFVGEGTVFPLELTREQAVYCYWKVKRWIIVVDLLFDLSPDPPYISSNTFYANAGELIFTSGAATSGPFIVETDLMFPRGMTTGDDTTTSNFILFASEDGGDEISGIPHRVVEFDGLIYPAFVMEAEVSSGPNTYHGTNSAGTLTFLDQTIALTSDVTGWSGTIDIQADEEWSYS